LLLNESAKDRNVALVTSERQGERPAGLLVGDSVVPTGVLTAQARGVGASLRTVDILELDSEAWSPVHGRSAINSPELPFLPTAHAHREDAHDRCPRWFRSHAPPGVRGVTAEMNATRARGGKAAVGYDTTTIGANHR
jgi:hypothetical protein